MWIIRLALTAIVLVLVLLIGVIEHVITWVVGKINPDASLRMRSSYVRMGTKLVWLIAAGKTTVIGKKKSRLTGRSCLSATTAVCWMS